MFNQSRWAKNCTVTPLFYICCYGAFIVMSYTEQQIQQDCDVCGAKESIRTVIRKDIGQVKVSKCRNCGVLGKWKAK